jgi:hypothetical protein
MACIDSSKVALKPLKAETLWGRFHRRIFNDFQTGSFVLRIGRSERVGPAGDGDKFTARRLQREDRRSSLIGLLFIRLLLEFDLESTGLIRLGADSVDDAFAFVPVARLAVGGRVLDLNAVAIREFAAVEINELKNLRSAISLPLALRPP